MNKIIKLIAKLNQEAKVLFDRIFEVRIEKAKNFFPEVIKEKFQEAENQEIIIIKNKILYQETHFNIWRAKRKEPQRNKSEFKSEEYNHDPFCNVLDNTPYDEFGRLENESAITASNLAKSSKNHSLIIFKKHNITQEDIEKAFELAVQWFSKFEKSNKKIIIWNYGYRSGASIIHPHLQVLSLSDLPLKFVYLWQKFKEYKIAYNSDYLDDLFLISSQLGIAKKINNLKIVINLTPFKDDEIIFFDSNLVNVIKSLSILIYRYLNVGIENFNFFLIENEKSLLGYLINRGKTDKINSDIGSLEIYSFSVVGSDPFELANRLFVDNRN